MSHMLKNGIYEQILNQLFEKKLSLIDQTRFYIGERSIDRNEVAKLLSMYLSGIFENMLSNVVEYTSNDDDDDES
ncbi:MAG: hypothetical protein J6R79_05205 [Bacteroidaceae bacterium]|nr:hypothetical protein [Bacteroidaceae bacterium]